MAGKKVSNVNISSPMSPRPQRTTAATKTNTAATKYAAAEPGEALTRHFTQWRNHARSMLNTVQLLLSRQPATSIIPWKAFCDLRRDIVPPQFDRLTANAA
jgi:hypothetical protein